MLVSDGLSDLITNALIPPTSVSLYAGLAGLSAVVRIVIVYPRLTRKEARFIYSAGNWMRSAQSCHLYANGEKVPTMMCDGPQLSLSAPVVPLSSTGPTTLEIRMLTLLTLEDRDKLCLLVPIPAFLGIVPKEIVVAIQPNDKRRVLSVYTPADLASFRLNRRKDLSYIATMTSIDVPNVFKETSMKDGNAVIFPIIVAVGVVGGRVDWQRAIKGRLPPWAPSSLPVLFVLVMYFLM